jgi:SsrA-binding protein
MADIIANNRKAFHDYEILEQYEAGLVLTGSEVKAIRARRVNLKDSFVKIIKGEAFWLNGHISYLETTHSFFKPDERRSRKLLLNRKEINKLIGKTSHSGLTITVLSLYFTKKNIAKLKIALAKGKKDYDKREDLKQKNLQREIQIALKNNY